MPRLRFLRRSAAGGQPTGEIQVFHHSFFDFFRALPGTAKRFWVLVIFTGAAAGLGAVALVDLLTLVQRLSWPEAANFLSSVRAAPPWRRLLIPLIAGLIVTAVALRHRRPLGGHGTAGIIEAIWLRAGQLSFGRSLVRGAVSIVAVAMGASLGREGALLSTGAAVGSTLARRLRVSHEQARLLVACGASAGIAAAYNVPIGGALFGLEVLLGSFALELFGPIVVSCVVATMISRVLVADHPSYLIPHYRLFGAHELVLNLVFAPVLGAASALYVRVIDGLADLGDRAPARLLPWLPPIALVGCGAAAVWLPHLLGNGYDTVDLALSGVLPIGLLLLLPFAKLLATALCSASGIPGGLFTPSLFYGALIGGALGHVAQWLWPGAAPAGAYALLGMGAVLAGTTHAAVSAVLIIFEMTGDYDVILPLMLSCVVSAAVSRRLEPESLYTAALRRRKVELPEPARPAWLRATPVRDFVDERVDVVGPGEPFAQVVTRLLLLPAGYDLYVAAPDRRLLGVIVLDALKRNLGDLADLEMIVAADVMAPVEPVTPELALSELGARFATIDLERLPVVDGRTRRLVGTVAKRSILGRARY